MRLFNVAKDVGEITFSQLNETSNKMFVDAVISIKPDDWCPIFDDEFDPDISSSFIGEVSHRPTNWDEVSVCKDLFADEFDVKLYDFAGEYANREDEGIIAREILEEKGFEFTPIYGSIGKDNSVNYSLENSNNGKVYGYILTDATRANELAQLYVDRKNGKDISLHAVAIWDKGSKAEMEFAGMPHGEARDEAIMNFIDNGGQFVPKSELEYTFKLNSAKDIKNQVLEGKSMDELPALVGESPTLSKVVVSNYPKDLAKINSGIVNEDFLNGVIARMSFTHSKASLNDKSVELLAAVKQVKPELYTIAAGNAIRHGNVKGQDLGMDSKTAIEVYSSVVKWNPDLLNRGEHNGVSLSEIPKNVLLSAEITNIIAEQMDCNRYMLKGGNLVHFNKLPKELQEHPIILGREMANNLSLLSTTPPELKANSLFLQSLFEPLEKEEFAEVFSRLYGGVDKAPKEAKAAAVSKIYLNEKDVRAVLDATFGKSAVEKMISEGQRAQFGHEKGFAPNLGQDGYKHLHMAGIKLDATGEIKELNLIFDNGYVEPDGDHAGWQSTRNHIVKDFDKSCMIQVPMTGAEKAKKSLEMALGGEKPKEVWTPTPSKDEGHKKDLNRHLSMDENHQVRG